MHMCDWQYSVMLTNLFTFLHQKDQILQNKEMMTIINCNPVVIHEAHIYLVLNPLY